MTFVKPLILQKKSLAAGSTRPATLITALAHSYELAFIDSRATQEVSPADWEQAKRELTGKPDMDSKKEIIESAPGSERWDPVPGSNGQKVQVAASEDKETEGRGDNERLFEQGIKLSARENDDPNHDIL